MGRKRKSTVDESTLSAEERDRREWQRHQRAQAVELRAGGEEYINLTKKKRKPLEARRLEKRLLKRKKESAAQRREIQKEVKRQKLTAPEVVIVPIFWKGEAKQMARVLSACADVQAALKDTGKRIELDAGHKYTPGQKFAHWEHKGVLLRVEVGPREAERGCCTIARTFTPGHPAHRVQRVAIGSESLPEALEKLAALEAVVEDGEEAGADAAPAAVAAEPEDAETSGAASATRRGGDDLDDGLQVAWGGQATGEADGEEDDDQDDQPKKKKKKKSTSSAEVNERKPQKKPSAQPAVKRVSF